MGRYSSHKQRGATFQRHCIAGIATILREGGRTEAMPRGRVIHWCEGSRDFAKVWVTDGIPFMNQLYISCIYISIFFSCSIIIASCNSVFVAHYLGGIWAFTDLQPGLMIGHGTWAALVFDFFLPFKNTKGIITATVCESMSKSIDHWYAVNWKKNCRWDICQHKSRKEQEIRRNRSQRGPSFKSAPFRIHLSRNRRKITCLLRIDMKKHNSKHVFVWFILVHHSRLEKRDSKYMSRFVPSRLASLGGARSVDLAVHQSLSLPGARSRGFKWL